jgi:hypothetical protein
MHVRRKTVIQVANEKVPFTTAAKWAGLGSDTRERGMKSGSPCLSCGGQGALRVYPDHGYCFSERKWYTTVSLLAEFWQTDREHAAIRALAEIGYRLPDYTDLWALASRDPEPAREALATALRTWCEANCPDWRVRQYDPAVARRLSQCLGLLPLVRTEGDCRLWLDRCKAAMGKVLFPL